MNQSLFFVSVVAAVIAVLSLFNFALLKYYTDPVESIKPVLMVQVAALTVISLHALMIPLDSENALFRNQGTIDDSRVQKFLTAHDL